MQVLLDGEVIAVERPTLAAALGAARRVSEARGRVIIEAKLDDVAIPDDLLSDPTEDEFAGSIVTMVTANPRTLVTETLAAVSDALRQSRAEQVAAADLLQTGRVQEAMQRMGSVLTTWDQARQAVISGAALLGEPLSAGTSAGRVAEAAGALGAVLSAIKGQVAAEDWSGLADTLAVDLCEQSDRWCDLLGTIGTDRAARPDNGAI